MNIAKIVRIDQMRIFVPKCNKVVNDSNPYKQYVSYDKYLESDHWTQTKQKSERIYGNRCVVCETHEDIEHHHIHYPDNHLDILAHQVLPLCKKCHKAYHSSAPNGGINTKVTQSSQIDKLIRSVFTHVRIGRNLDKADPKWVNLLLQRSNKISKIFRQCESQRYQKRL